MRSLMLTLPLAMLLMAATSPNEAALDDARCLLVLGQLGASQDETAQRAGQLGSQYYFGRLDGREVSDLEALLNEAAATMKPEDLDSTLQRCGAVLQERDLALQAIGERMISDAGAQ